MLFDGNGPAEGMELSDIRDFFKNTENWSRTWLIQMAFIASISLLVGGIGLMNVMLTRWPNEPMRSVCASVGRRFKAVLHQFLVESIRSADWVGFIGVVIGLLASYSLTVVTKGKVLISILPASLVVSFGFSM